MPTLTLADLRNMQPAGATRRHLEMLALLACYRHAVGAMVTQEVVDWATGWHGDRTVRVSVTLPQKSEGPFESL